MDPLLLESRYIEVYRGRPRAKDVWYLDRWKRRLIIAFGDKINTIEELGGGRFAGEQADNYIPDGTPAVVKVYSHIIFTINHDRLNAWAIAPKEYVKSRQWLQDGQCEINRCELFTTQIPYLLKTLDVPTDLSRMKKVDAEEVTTAKGAEIFFARDAKLFKAQGYVTCEQIRDQYAKDFMRILKNFAMRHKVEVKECKQYCTFSEYKSEQFVDEDILTMVFLLTSPVYRAFYTPDARLLAIVMDNFGFSQEIGEKTPRFMHAKNLATFVRKTIGIECPRLIKQFAKYMMYRRPRRITKFVPDDAISQDKVINAMIQDYFIEDVKVVMSQEPGDDHIQKFIELSVRPYTIQSLAVVGLLRGAFLISENVDIVCDIFDQLLEDSKYMQKHALRYRKLELDINSSLSSIEANMLKRLGVKKSIRLFREAVDNWGMFKDALYQWREFDNPANIPDILKEAFPDGLQPPKKFKNLKEFHDIITRDYAAIKRACHENRPIRYPEIVEKLDKIPVADMTLVLPRQSGDLIEWGTLMNNCIGGYDSRACTGELLLFGLYDKEEVKMVGEIRLDGTISQLVIHHNNRADKKYWNAVQELITEEIKTALTKLPDLYDRPAPIKKSEMNLWGDGEGRIPDVPQAPMPQVLNPAQVEAPDAAGPNPIAEGLREALLAVVPRERL